MPFSAPPLHIPLAFPYSLLYPNRTYNATKTLLAKLWFCVYHRDVTNQFCWWILYYVCCIQNFLICHYFFYMHYCVTLRKMCFFLKRELHVTKEAPRVRKWITRIPNLVREYIENKYSCYGSVFQRMRWNCHLVVIIGFYLCSCIAVFIWIWLECFLFPGYITWKY